ncbi:chitin synthase-domain-containing protein [Blastocladiella britannica]|nr:chitin synthase-domain-containing protein [Blastocladiella britannica]
MGGASTVSSSSSTPPPAASQQPKATPTRRRWLFFTWLITFWVPPFMMGICCGLKDRAAQMAWREKVAICFVIFVMSGAMLFAIVFAGVVVCPPRNLFSFNELGFMSTPDTASAGTAKKWYAAVHGRVYNLYDLSITSPDSHPTSRLRGLLSYDLSAGFPRNPSLYCGSLSPDVTMTAVPEKVPDKLFGIDVLTGHNKTKDGNLDNKINSYLLANSRGFLAISKADVETSWNPKNKNDMTRKRIIVSGVVYDLTNYYLLPRDKQFLGNAMFKLATGEVRRADDYMALTATTSSVDLSADDEFMAKVWNSNGGFRSCMDALFAEAVVDERQSIKCLAADWVLFGMSVVMFSVIGIKFLAALLLPRAQFVPEKMDRFVMLQVPAYTEDETSMRKTLNSLANLNYDDKHKLIVVLCDGMIVGRGNDRPTPHIVLDILGVDPSAYDEAPLLSYESVGDGPGLLTNMARVYSGLYEVEGRLVPYLVIAKCGKAGEISRPGNRGKRDSQMILMRFLNKVHTGKPMSPLECELQWHIERLIGIDPKWYEFMLMVDADTTVDPEALSQLVAFSLTDTRLVGVCGETRLSNEKKSFTTMIQVYEYFISHHLSKAFESIFGSVTCLPGCFCMYRIFSSGPKPKPLLVHDKVVDAYADTNVDTLHKKNLLALGEDRYLTTLVLSTFPSMKTKFTPAAMAYTAAPESISVLLSQRRRWINSTIHNLLELMRVQALCAFCCFSMRFVVLLDLVATLVQPAMVVYLGYLVFLTVRAIQLEQSLNLVMVSFLMLAAVYGAQAFVFLMKREFAHIMWMFIYLLALPIFGFFIPLYSFWCMDTFSWGNTRSLAKGADQGGASGAHDDLSAELCPPPTDDPRDLPQWTFAEYVARRGQFADAVDRHVAHAAATAAAAAAAAKPRSVAMSSRSWHDRAVPVPSPVTLLPPGLGSGSPRGSYMAPSPRASYIGAPVPSSRESMYATGVSIPGIGGGGSPHHRNNSPGIAMQPLHAVSPSGVPTEEQLTAEICRILEASDLMQVTKRGVRAELESLFGVDLAPQRAFINATIDRVLQVMAQDS